MKASLNVLFFFLTKRRGRSQGEIELFQVSNGFIRKNFTKQE
jgi:hypothetical protein